MAVEDNRQLHQAEITWINDNAKKFADQEGISLEEAKDRLAQQALRDVDAIWNIALGEDDAVAQTFIAENIGENDTFENTRGEQQVFFTTENGDFYDPSRYAVQSLQADPQLYQNAQQTAKEKTGELLSNPDKLKDAIEKKFDVNLNDVLEYANDKINANKDKNLEEMKMVMIFGQRSISIQEKMVQRLLYKIIVLDINLAKRELVIKVLTSMYALLKILEQGMYQVQKNIIHLIIERSKNVFFRKYSSRD